MNKKYVQIKNIKHGSNFKVIEPVNIFDSQFGDNVFIGAFCEIQNDCFVGSNTVISSHSSICSHVKIGENCFIGHGVIFVNDKFNNKLSYAEKKKDTNSWLKKTSVGNNCQIGSNATIVASKITSNVIIGAGSVVIKDIIKPGVYAGNPAIKIK